MKGARIIAYVQIVLSIVFVVIALKVQLGSASLFDQYADTCQNFADVVRKHNTDGYQPLMQSLFTMKEPLKEVGGKIGGLASVMEATGAALQKPKGLHVRNVSLYPESLVALGRSLQTTSESIGRAGNVMVAQSEAIAKFQDDDYDETVRTLDKAAENFDQASCKLRQLKSKLLPFVFCIIIIGAAFFLNGIALLILTKNFEVHGKNEVS